MIFSLGKMSLQDKKPFKREIAKANKEIISRIAGGGVLIQIFMIIWAIFSHRSGTFRYNFYLAAYISQLAFGTAYLVFYFFGKNLHENVIALNIANSLYFVFVIAWATVISILDSKYYTAPVVLITVLILITGMTYIYPSQNAVYIFCSFSAFMISARSMGYITCNAGYTINMTILIFALIAVSVIKFNLKKNDFILRREVMKSNMRLYETNSRLAELNFRLEKMSKTDMLTGLFNRWAGSEKLGELCEKSKKEKVPLSLVMYDIDNFKSINDKYGHSVGDQCLTEVANIFRQEFGADCVYRYGGEEFVVMFCGLSEEEAFFKADKLREDISKTNFTDKHLKIAVSGGIYTALYEGKNSPSQYLIYADRALYSAKISGKNRVCEFHPDRD